MMIFVLSPPPSFSDDVILFTIFWDGVPNICKMGGGVGQSPFFSQYSERLMYFHENIDGTVFSYLIIFLTFLRVLANPCNPATRKIS